MGASGDEKRRDSIAAEEAGRLDLLLVLLFLLLVLESGEGERDVSPHCSVPEGRESLCPVFLLSKRMVTMSLNLPPRGDDDQADTELQPSKAQVHGHESKGESQALHHACPPSQAMLKVANA